VEKANERRFRFSSGEAKKTNAQKVDFFIFWEDIFLLKVELFFVIVIFF